MKESPHFSWKNSRILVADDEPDMREIFSAWFRNLGCAVTEAADGQEALEALGVDHFDAIVTDVRMPRLSGIQLLHQLHQSRRYIPAIIFVSGFVDLALPDAFDLGVEAVMSKPCEKKDLVATVRRSLLRRQLVFEASVLASQPVPNSFIEQSSSLGAPPAGIALGRGGLSLNSNQNIAPDSMIGFSISFASGPVTHLAGCGVLRWSETGSKGTRVGVEFLQLDDESRVQFARWLEANDPVSFIPKDCQSQFVSAQSQ